jgi:hypothetical protein
MGRVQGPAGRLLAQMLNGRQVMATPSDDLARRGMTGWTPSKGLARAIYGRALRDPTFIAGSHCPIRRAEDRLDDDLADLAREDLIAEVRRLRHGIREHRDSSGHELCWHHPRLWCLLPEQIDPAIAVPPWPKFLRGCVKYRNPTARRRGIGRAPCGAPPPCQSCDAQDEDRNGELVSRAAYVRRSGGASLEAGQGPRRYPRPGCRDTPRHSGVHSAERDHGGNHPTGRQGGNRHWRGGHHRRALSAEHVAGSTASTWWS